MLNVLVRKIYVLIVAGLLLLGVVVHQTACFQCSSSSINRNNSIRGNINKNSGMFAVPPRVIVFDLDNTLWTPELYQLRRLERANQIPVAGKDVKLFDGAKEILDNIIPSLGADGSTKPILAIASRTKSVDWAELLIDEFKLRERFDVIEIFPGIKTNHFTRIQRATNVPFHEMMFFDDARDGKYGNCVPVAAMGVFCVHCPEGLKTKEVFENALDLFQNKWDKTPNTIVEWDGQMTTNVDAQRSEMTRYEKTKLSSSNDSEMQEGVVKLIKREKRYGFIKYRTDYGKNSSKDVFFHFSSLLSGSQNGEVEEGDEVTFQLRKDLQTNNKEMAVNVDLLTNKNIDNDSTKVQFRCFSMNNPFAALLANGYKSLESRNGTMFAAHSEGTQLLLHVGQRTYPDGNKHLDIMKSASPGISDNKISELKTLRSGFKKGDIVAILEIGKTYETTELERSQSDFERGVVAYGCDSGRIVTEIKRVAYLKKPIRQKGESGIFTVKIDPDLIPDGWSIPSMPYKTDDQFFATITG
jgi:magnesium-dependent phosphatase 1